ncbi:MAG TPA: hypothetical protein VFB94_26205 [Acidimicrobiales bacterium]|nr:hypothetical protein [Acidimicrobiales bacterium]
MNRARDHPTDGGSGDRGAGALSTAIGFLVFLTCMFLALQVIFGLYATSTVRATLDDAASLAANGGGATPAELQRLAAEAEQSLGAVGRRPSTVIELEIVDEDGDGVGDVVVGHAVVEPPRFAPGASIFGFDLINASVRVQVEHPRA